MRISTLSFFINAIFLITLLGCDDPKPIVTVAPTPIQLEVEHMEQDLFGHAITNYDSLNAAMQLKYGEFYDIVIGQIGNITDPKNPDAGRYLKQFIEYPGIAESGQLTVTRFQDFSAYQTQLQEAFERYKSCFPDSSIPKVVTFFSVFNYAVVATDSVLGIGLDMYLGKDFEYYPSIGFPLYKIAKLEPQYIVADALKGWLQTTFENDLTDADMLLKMVDAGKTMVALDALLPEMPDSLKMGYSAAQMEWCQQNEFNIWAHFVDKQLLYTKDTAQIAKFFNEGPFTSGFDKQSPSQIGVWVGWQIVRKYVSKNPKITIAQLLQHHNAQEILAKSAYKPSK